ncbi:tetratricopeptide repeat protein [Pseudomonadota bacterium]
MEGKATPWYSSTKTPCFHVWKLSAFLLLINLGLSTPSIAGELEQGIQQYQAENYEEALPLFKQALQTSPKTANVHTYLAATYIQLLEYDQAKQHLLKATATQAGNGRAWLLLADAHYTLGEYPQASDALDKAENILGSSGQGEYLYGLILFKGNDYRPAQKHFEQAAQFDPVLKQKAFYYIALSHLNLGDKNKAAQYFEEAHSLDPSSETAFAAQRALLTLDAENPDQDLIQDKPYSLSLGYALEYDDNVVLKPSSTIANLQISNEDDIRHVMRLDARYTKPWGGKNKIRMGYKLYQSHHVTLSTYDLRSQSLMIEPAVVGDNNEKTLGLAYDYMSLNNDKYLTLLRLSPSYKRDYNNGDRGAITLDIQNMDYAAEPSNTAENRDSNNINLSYFHYRFFKQQRYFLLGYRFNQSNADGNNWDYQGHKLLATLHSPINQKLSATLALDYQKLDFDNTHNTLGQTRQDNDYTISATLRWKNVMALNIVPLDIMAQALYNNNDSNLAIYDYQRQIAKLGASYHF